MVSSSLLFVFFILFFVFLPAAALGKLLKISPPDDHFVTFGLWGVVGIVQLTLITFIVRFFGLEFWILWSLPIISLLYLFRQRIEVGKINIQLNKSNFFILGVLLFCALAQNFILLPAGLKGVEGYYFPFMHDTMWGIALLVELSKHFPPQNPGMLGLPLVNNHYFYPLFLASVYKITNINIIDLYFHLAPVFVSVLFGLGLYAASSLFTKNRFFRGLTIFLGFFCGNISYILILFFGTHFNWGANTFLVDQPFNQIVNPYTVLGFSFILFNIFVISKIMDSKNRIHWGWVTLLVLITGASYGFKSFGGIVMMGGLAGSIILYSIISGRLKLISIIFLSCILFFPIFFFITEPSKAKLNFYPGWILTEMMTNKDGLNLPVFGQIESYYRSIGNVLGLIKIKGIELVIYLLGNLGVRIFGVVLLVGLLIRRKVRDSLQLPLWYMAFCILISFSIPLLFNLNVTAYNIVQFTPYALVILAVTTSIFLEKMYFFLLGKKLKIIAILLLIGSISAAVPVNIKNLNTKLYGTVDTLSVEKIAGIDFIRENTSEDTIILIDPRQFINDPKNPLDPIFVSAMTQRRVYLSSPGFVSQTGKDPTERASLLYRYFDEKTAKFEDKKTIGENYVLFLKKPNDIFFLKKTKNEGVRTLFENEEILILGR